MQLPDFDQYWLEAISYLEKHVSDTEKIIAPTEFSNIIPNIIYSYDSWQVNRFQWAVVHKGMTGQINQKLLQFIVNEFSPVFANEVFVIFIKRMDINSPHLISFFKKLKLRRWTEIIRRFRSAINCLESYEAIKLVKKSLIGQVNIENYSPSLVPVKSGNQNGIYIGNYKALTRTFSGHKIFVDTRDLTLAPHILLDGYWEMWVTKVFMQTIKENMKVLEIGANIGYYTLLAASLVGKNGKVISFEANPETFETLSWSIEINGFLDRVELVNKIALDKSKKIVFFMRNRHRGNSSIGSPSEVLLTQGNDEAKEIEIQSISIDEYLTERMQIDVIKIDAEGSEPYIFQGMQKTLTQNHQVKIICEFCPAQIIGTGANPREFLELIVELGFTLKIIDFNSNTVETSINELLETPHCELFLQRK